MASVDLSSDFELLTDELEPVMLRSRVDGTEQFVEKAYRQQVDTQEMQPSGGSAVQADVVWHLQMPPDVAEPQLGDVIVDQQKQRWTILEAHNLRMLGRYRCVARELRLAYGCHQRIDVQRAVWGDEGSGPEIVDWIDVGHALPVSIRLDELILDSSTTPPTKQLVYEFVLSESIDLEPDDRLIDEAGTSYRLQSLQGAARIDTLPVAKAIREDTD